MDMDAGPFMEVPLQGLYAVWAQVLKHGGLTAGGLGSGDFPNTTPAERIKRCPGPIIIELAIVKRDASPVGPQVPAAEIETPYRDRNAATEAKILRRDALQEHQGRTDIGMHVANIGLGPVQDEKWLAL